MLGCEYDQQKQISWTQINEAHNGQLPKDNTDTI